MANKKLTDNYINTEYQEKSLSLLDQYFDLVAEDNSIMAIASHYAWLQSAQAVLVEEYLTNKVKSK